MNKITVTIPNRTVGIIEKDYNRLQNLPTLNGVVISGDKQAGDYNLPDMWYGTRAEYNALPETDPQTIYFIEEGT